MLSYLPNPDTDVSNGQSNFTRSAEINDRAMMYTGKVDHRFSDGISLSGFYLYNATDEPCGNVLYPGLNEPNRFIDNADYLLIRRVHTLALNNTWLPSSNTVVTMRYGMTKFIDDDTLSIDFDPSTLGFASAFSNAIQTKKFPIVNLNSDYYALGAHRPGGSQLVFVERQRHRVQARRPAHLQGRASIIAISAMRRSRSPAAPATSISIAATPRRFRRRTA